MLTATQEKTMTDDEFQRLYHEYQADNEAQARQEAESITLENGQHPAVVGLPFGSTIRFCLMLPKAASFLGGLYPGKIIGP
jgi:hypothetical protein